ncbi:hypothetical protein [Myxacorys almedinensis]|uniref:Uncharacterized protein n=1 Tax=Myxacorys almedinensis A TaxID=2690445 RepID=A0A8J7Z396_9CYAN|nr:hypothetical protein [Myxacorys almedinensis]NDJ19587.1 hypothetical protein [Myxacorys almedinensis A]
MLGENPGQWLSDLASRSPRLDRRKSTQLLRSLQRCRDAQAISAKCVKIFINLLPLSKSLGLLAIAAL